MIAPGGAAEALEESEARLQALLSSLDDLVFELDENGTYLGIWTANDALLFAPRDQLLGRTHGDVIGEDMALAILRAFLAVPYEGGRHDARLAKLTPSGGNP